MKIGFIGCGNMGECILKGLVMSKKYLPGSICVYNRTAETVDRLCREYGVHRGASGADVVVKSDIVIIGVKPHAVCPLLETLRDVVTEEKIIISVAAAITIASMEKALAHPRKIVRAMPNTPTRVGAGLTSVSPNSVVTREEVTTVLDIFGTIGKAVELPESQIHAVISVAGSSPAYVFMFMEAMGDAAVLSGLPRDQAYAFAAQAVLGAAKMLQECGMSPAQLKDIVCSPGGTTIEAVRQLERGGMRSAVIEAMIACAEKSRALEAKLN